MIRRFLPHARRGGHLLLRLAAGLGAGLAVLIGLVAWQLSQGPVSLDFLSAPMARALATNSAVQVAIDHTLLSLTDRRLELVARGVHLSRPDLGSQLTLRELWLGLSPVAAIHGTLAPTHIDLIAPVLHLQRDADGQVLIGFGDNAASVSDDWVGKFLGDLARPPNREGPLGYLTEVALRDAALTMDDRALGTTWQASQVNATLRRGKDGLHIDVGLAAGVGGLPTRIVGTTNYNPVDQSLSFAIRFDDLHLAEWKSSNALLTAIAGVAVPVGGEIDGKVDLARLAVKDLACDLKFGKGQIANSAIPTGSVAIAGGGLHLDYDPAAGRVALSNLTLDLGGPQITGEIILDGLGGAVLEGKWPAGFTGSASIGVQQLNVNDFSKLWPNRVAPNPRLWVTQNIHDGKVEALRATAAFAVDLSIGAAEPLTLQKLDGTLVYSNLTIDYFSPLPPVRGVTGTAVFDGQHILFSPTSGDLQGMKVIGGTVNLFDLDTHSQHLALDLSLSGPLKNLLDVLNDKPLYYARDLGIDPESVAGDFDADIKFAFPLLNSLRFDQVTFGAQSKLTGMGIAKVLFDRDLSDGSFDLQLDPKTLELDGVGKLGGLPMAIQWTHALTLAAPVQTRYVIHAALDDAARSQLGLSALADTIHGPALVDIDYVLDARQHAQAKVAVDLAKADVSVVQVGWKKPAGTPAMVRFIIDADNDHLTAIRDATMSGGGMNAKLTAAFDGAPAAMGLREIDIPYLSAGNTNITATIMRQPAGGWQARIAGTSFDAGVWFTQMNHSQGSDADDPPLTIDASLDQLVLGPNRKAISVQLSLVSDGPHWQQASIDAALPKGATTVRFGMPIGDRKVTLHCDDFGGLLRFLGISDNVADGRFDLDGAVEDRGSKRVLRGRAVAVDYRIVHGPVFARVLSLASFSGIGALLSGEGIPFAHLQTDFVYDGGKITADDLRAYGSAIGINVKGVVDDNANTIDIAGTLVPAYSLNSVLGDIPVLGKLLMGGPGQGLFGANFRVSGNLDNPRVAVNPLSALAPGVLRNLFLFDAPRGGAKSPASAAAPNP